MNVLTIIDKKRTGKELGKEEIEFLLNGYNNSEIPDYQMSAFLMAVMFKGMTDRELHYFTDTMLHSGEIIEFPKGNKFILDKHSTGGVGDKTTLALAPLLVSLGFGIAKLSGRGLGFTGGTIDKLESIPGFQFQNSAEGLRNLLDKTGIGLMGYTDKIVPLDKKIYSLRDVCGTVESIPLIASSIMSKKLALASDAILLDIKTGGGALIQDPQGAITLAETMRTIGRQAGKRVACVISSMEQPLGSAIGNSLEFIEAMETLKNKGPDDLTELLLYLAGMALYLKKDVVDVKEGIEIAKSHLGTPKVLVPMKTFLSLSGADPRVVDDYSLLPKARYKISLISEAQGFVERFDCSAWGNAAMLLGAGRETKDSKIDHSVGILVLKKIGHHINIGESLADIYYNDETKLDSVMTLLKNSITISSEEVKIKTPIHSIIE